MEFKQRPKFTERYSAIDGIAKGDRNFREVDGGGQYYSAAEDAIRPDIVKILEMSDVVYHSWFNSRFQATSRLLQQWSLFASIPCLNYGDKQYKMDAMSSIKMTIDYLRDGIDYLTKIDDLRISMKVKGD